MKGYQLIGFTDSVEAASVYNDWLALSKYAIMSCFQVNQQAHFVDILQVNHEKPLISYDQYENRSYIMTCT